MEGYDLFDSILKNVQVKKLDFIFTTALQPNFRHSDSGTMHFTMLSTTLGHQHTVHVTEAKHFLVRHSNFSSTFRQNFLAIVKRWPFWGGPQQQDLSEWIRFKSGQENVAVVERWPLWGDFQQQDLSEWIRFKAGQENLAVVERWPLVDVRLH